MLFMIGDDAGLAAGPVGFHRKTLRQMLGRAVFCGIVPGAPERAFYGRAIRTAVERKGWAVLIETQPQLLASWARFAAHFAGTPVEICGRQSGTGQSA